MAEAVDWPAGVERKRSAPQGIVTALDTSNGSAKNIPNDRTVVSRSAKPSR